MTIGLKDIVKSVASIGPNEDIFAYWSRELEGRKRVRSLISKGARLELEIDRDVLDFLFRVLCLSQSQRLLYRVLWDYSDQMAVIRWLGDRSEGFRLRFLQQLAELWPQKDGRGRRDFLINIYTPALTDAYRRLLAGFDSKDIDYLISRTANPELRRLLREEKEKIEIRARESRLGVAIHKVRARGLDCIFGNKTELAKSLLSSLEQAEAELYEHPYRVDRLLKLCECCVRLFELGWIEDSLVLTVETYSDFMERGRLQGREAVRVYRRLDRLARAVIPVYCLLEFGENLGREVEKLYRSCLSQLVVENASLAYLELYERLQEARSTPSVYPRSEVERFCLRLAKTRPDDAIIKCLKGREREGVDIEGCMQAVGERMKSRPHEAFVIMEFVRLVVMPGLDVRRKSKVGESMLTRYLDLWGWVPNVRFMNREIAESLSAVAKGETRRQVFDVLRWTEAFANRDNQLYSNKKELVRGKGSKAALQAFLGRVLGVTD